jgi:hypothetical protein
MEGIELRSKLGSKDGTADATKKGAALGRVLVEADGATDGDSVASVGLDGLSVLVGDPPRTFRTVGAELLEAFGCVDGTSLPTEEGAVLGEVLITFAGVTDGNFAAIVGLKEATGRVGTTLFMSIIVGTLLSVAVGGLDGISDDGKVPGMVEGRLDVGTTAD